MHSMTRCTQSFRFSSLVAAMGVATALTAAAWGQDCPPCQEHEDWNVTTARAQLTEAFRLSLEVTDCSGADNRATCRQIDNLTEDVLEAVEAVFAAYAEKTIPDCLTCDPRTHLWPIMDGVQALHTVLQEKGYNGFADSSRLLLGRLEVWKAFRCPCTDGTADTEGDRPVPKRDRETDARIEITRKCGERFADARRGLLQVFRVPNDRKGCYQSRACREATLYKGFQTEAGFWTYDGEYWYIWEERRGNSGRWVSCER